MAFVCPILGHAQGPLAALPGTLAYSSIFTVQRAHGATRH
jgi:hypothetical protein